MPLDSIEADAADNIETAAPAVAVHRIEIRETGYNNRGPLYTVTLGDEVLLTRSREPMCEAARLLAARGLTGPLEMWRQGATACAMRSTIEAAAGLTVEDGSSAPPTVRKWRPIDIARDSAQNPGETD